MSTLLSYIYVTCQNNTTTVHKKCAGEISTDLRRIRPQVRPLHLVVGHHFGRGSVGILLVSGGVDDVGDDDGAELEEPGHVVQDGEDGDGHDVSQGALLKIEKEEKQLGASEDAITASAVPENRSRVQVSTFGFSSCILRQSIVVSEQRTLIYPASSCLA